MKKPHRGFTLIELLVVISIIATLSSVVLVSINGARLKAKDAAIRQDMNQLRLLIEKSAVDTGDYSDWQSTSGCGGFGSSFYCVITPTGGGGNNTCYGTFTQSAIKTPSLDAEKICNHILSTVGLVTGKANLVIGIPMNLPDDPAKYYSIVAYLPGKNTYLCIGNDGMSDTSTSYDSGPLNYDPSAALGCFLHP